MSTSARPLVGVVGHVEWVQFARVAHVPVAGEIVHAGDVFEEPAGGGGVAAVQLARLAGSARFFTALGDDACGARAATELRERFGVQVEAAPRAGPQRRAFTLLDDDAERTITVLGGRMVPLGRDPLAWQSLGALDAVYVTGGDAEAVRAARAARVLVATARAIEPIAAAGVAPDVLVSSANDPGERYEAGMLDPPPLLVVRTAGAAGGTWEAGPGSGAGPSRSADAGGDLPAWLPSEPSGSWQAMPLPGPPVDAYGCGDSFAAGLTYGLAARMALPAALELAARCGAACLCGRGPYGAKLELVSLV